MKKKSLLLVLVVIMVFAAASCTTFKLSGAQVTTTIPSYQAVGEFDIKVTVFEFLGTPGGANILNISSDAMDTKIYDAVQREIQKYTGDAAVNVTIEYKASVFDMLVAGFTGSLVAPCHAHISGTVVKYQ